MGGLNARLSISQNDQTIENHDEDVFNESGDNIMGIYRQFD